MQYIPCGSRGAAAFFSGGLVLTEVSTPFTYLSTTLEYVQLSWPCPVATHGGTLALLLWPSLAPTVGSDAGKQI